jgi:hypothetical protein
MRKTTNARRVCATAALAASSFIAGIAFAVHGGGGAARADPPPPSLPPTSSSAPPPPTSTYVPPPTTSAPPPATSKRHHVSPPPGRVTHLRFDNNGRYMTLTWKLPTSSTHLAHVYVKRTRDGGCSTGLSDGVTIGSTDVHSRTVDTTAVPGYRYCYTVFVVNAAGRRSSADNTPLVSMPDHTPPPAVKNVQTRVSGSSVVVSWSAAPGAARYLVMRGPAGACPAHSDAQAALAKPSAAGFTDTTAKPGTAYCYAVFPVDKYGNVRHTSTSFAKATVPAPTPKPVVKPVPASSHASSSTPFASIIALMVAAVAIAVVAFSLILLAALRVQARMRGEPYQPSRARGGALRIQAGHDDARALVVPAALGVGAMLLALAVAMLVL